MDTNGPTTSPHTPRGRNVYPAHLARAGEGPRVPLHRRGTSQTFECLEDLLREAGFKETRVFTPEAERTEAAAAEAYKKQAEEKREGKGHKAEKKSTTGLVGFLSGLVPWSDTEGGRRTVESRQSKTQSLGRAIGKQKQLPLDEGGGIPGATDYSSDALVTPTPHRRRPFTPIILTSDFSSPGSSSSTSSHSSRQRHPEPQSRFLPNPSSNKQQMQRARPDATTTLRHMISMPDFVLTQRTSRPAHALSRRLTANTAVFPSASRQQTARMRQHGPKIQLETETEAPPLPQNWLSTVAHAVLGASGTGGHVGRPQTSSQNQGHMHSRSANTDATRPLSDVQGSSEYARRNGSLARRGFAPRTPRADTTPGVVTAASVVCRSAPGSRSSSLVRTRSTGARVRGRPQARVRETCLPSLGVTSIELAGGRKMEDNINADAVHISADDSDDYSSDEGELDFARLIVPARRQHSIHSLRRHLHNHVAASAASGGGKAPPSAYDRGPKRPHPRMIMSTHTNLINASESGSDLLDGPDGLDELLRSRRASADEYAEDDGLFADWTAHGLPGLKNAVRKKRGALPWASRTQGR